MTQWWGGPDRDHRVESANAWRGSADDLQKDGYNLDLRNPRHLDDLTHRSPHELINEMIATEERILEVLRQIEIDLPTELG
ncbi:MAG: SAM-dependent methyltransferase [Nocardioides sp.]|nr:SAM-dependent methyltransferase [Nocardioides sp.]